MGGLFLAGGAGLGEVASPEAGVCGICGCSWVVPFSDGGEENAHRPTRRWHRGH